jgi:hypothetical protein|tara:strand:- start:39 stop:503 length:465 start_codon:yes stop_codon:yes gene_type:complete
MSSPIIQIEDKIKTLIGVDYAAGYSGLNLTDRVIIGEVPDPPMIPFATVQFVDFIEESSGPQALGRYRGTVEFNIICFCAGTSAHVSTRRAQAINLSSDIIKALTADRLLGFTSGIVDDIRCSFLARDGDKLGIPNCGIGYIRVIVDRQTDRGD